MNPEMIDPRLLLTLISGTVSMCKPTFDWYSGLLSILPLRIVLIKSHGNNVQNEG